MVGELPLASSMQEPKIAGMLMKWLCLVLSALVLIPHTLAQVDVSLSFKKDFYLADEFILAELTIVNFSGKTLVFGEQPNWLTFSVESSRDTLVARQKELDIMGRFEIPNAGRGIRRVHLVPAFRMVDQGRYRIKATVEVPELELRMSTQEAELGILTANVLWEREFGWVSEGLGSEPEVRRYELMRSVSEKSIELYVKVSDQYRERVFGVYSLGNVVSFGQPERQVDRLSNLHVLFQNGARTFRYAIIKPDGRLLLQQRWDYSDTRPRLKLGDQGLIEVVGGLRQLSFDDIPSPDQLSEVRERNLEQAQSFQEEERMDQSREPEPSAVTPEKPRAITSQVHSMKSVKRSFTSTPTNQSWFSSDRGFSGVTADGSGSLDSSMRSSSWKD